MWYLLLYGILAIWVYVDGANRKINAIPWAIGTGIFGPIILPVYIAKRPLKAGEVRDGGTAWNVLRNFAVLWTILIVVVAVWGMMGVSQHTAALQTGAERAGAAIGTAIGLGLIAALWFFPMVGAVVLGFILKKASIVEKGPTGPLAAGSTQYTVAASSESSGNGLKKCPKCARKVLKKAVRCPFCRNVF